MPPASVLSAQTCASPLNITYESVLPTTPKHPSTHPLTRCLPPYSVQRTLEELFIKGPIANTRDNPEYQQVGRAGGLYGMPCWQQGLAQQGLPAAAAPPDITMTNFQPAPSAPSCLPDYLQESLEEQQEVLHAWHSWVLRELGLFKSKFRGAAATLLGAGDVRSFSLGGFRWAGLLVPSIV